jgi:signal transduction histidine kinase
MGMTKALKILIVEDEPLDARMLERLIAKSDLQMEEITTVETLQAALQKIAEQQFDVIFLDLGLPDGVAPSSVAAIRKQAAADTIVIILSGDDSKESCIEALAAGAQEYLIKSLVTAESLARAVSYAQERINLENKLLHQNAELALALEKIKMAQSELGKVERIKALGQMASGVAHDCNNALAAIQANIELILSDEAKNMPESAKREMLINILVVTQDASAVAVRLSHFNKYGGDRIEHQQVDLNETITEVVNITRPKWRDQARARGHTIEVETRLEPAASISGSPSEIREIITNLLFNSIDAIQQHGTIVFSTRVTGEEVWFEIADTGMGMDAEVKQKCYEPFFTTKRSNSDVSGGSGLGLSMAYGIIERHRATVQVESELGQGTQFRICFPVWSGTAKNLDEDTDVILPVRVAKIEKTRVLFVEDEMAIRNAISLFLTATGMECDVAEDGEIGLEKFKTGQYDIVVTDRSMPKMNGEQMVAEIRKYSDTVPIIMMTGYGDDLTPDEKRTIGINLLLTKPCKVSILKEKIERLVS